MILICRSCKTKIQSPNTLTIRDMPIAANSFSRIRSEAIKYISDMQIFKCSKCGVVQTTDKLLSDYKSVHRSSFFSTKTRDFRLKQMSAFTKKYRLNDKNILEIGCFKGEFVELFNQNLDGSFFGCEYSVNASSKDNVIEGYLGDQALKTSTKFSGFYSFNVFEHWPNWALIFSNLLHSIDKEAYGIIEVPNADYIISKGLYNEVISDHIYYFTLPSFAKALEATGLEVISINPILSNYVLSAEVKLPGEVIFENFNNKKDSLFKSLQEFFGDQDSSLVVWGAGHQSLATLSSIGKLSLSIDYVVDSSPFKLGKFTPGSGIEIKHPDTLRNEENTKRVLVICGSYNAEVIKILKSWSNKKLSVYTLTDGNVQKV